MTINTYRLPFEGEWFVLWGGNDAFLNYHYPYEHQRYAYDFIRKVDGAAHGGDEEMLEAYHAFGASVVAPRGGEVVKVVDDIEDNMPHYPNMSVPEGNHIIISHGYNEYSLLAHLRKHSITVKEGDTVETGSALHNAATVVHPIRRTSISMSWMAGTPIHRNRYASSFPLQANRGRGTGSGGEAANDDSGKRAVRLRTGL